MFETASVAVRVTRDALLHPLGCHHNFLSRGRGCTTCPVRSGPSTSPLCLTALSCGLRQLTSSVAEQRRASPLNALLCLSARTLQIHSPFPRLALSTVLRVPFPMVTDVFCSLAAYASLPARSNENNICEQGWPKPAPQNY